MNEFQYVSAERDRDTVTIWLNRPERLNVLSLDLMSELTRPSATSATVTPRASSWPPRAGSSAPGTTSPRWRGKTSRPCNTSSACARHDADHPVDPPARRRSRPRTRDGRRLPISRHLPTLSLRAKRRPSVFPVEGEASSAPPPSSPSVAQSARNAHSRWR
jgi:hypothetical protein